MAQEYSFLTPWRFDGATIFEVADILEDTASLPRWWPDLYGSTLTSTGDLIGTGIWRLAERDGGWRSLCCGSFRRSCVPFSRTITSGRCSAAKKGCVAKSSGGAKCPRANKFARLHYLEQAEDDCDAQKGGCHANNQIARSAWTELVLR